MESLCWCLSLNEERAGKHKELMSLGHILSIFILAETLSPAPGLPLPSEHQGLVAFPSGFFRKV